MGHPTLPPMLDEIGRRLSELPTTWELHGLADKTMRTVNRFNALLLFVAMCRTPSVADVCVYKPPKVRHIVGNVVDSSGRPIPAVNVAVIQGGESVASATTNDAGEFRFDSLKEGPYELTATANGFHSARYKVRLSHPTVYWNRSLQIELAVGLVNCIPDIKIVKAR